MTKLIELNGKQLIGQFETWLSERTGYERLANPEDPIQVDLITPALSDDPRQEIQIMFSPIKTGNSIGVKGSISADTAKEIRRYINDSQYTSLIDIK